ncbi:MAG: glutamate 5-kinase [Pseudomonadaceae bacterium]|nr:glutamate 5-kinase [Pseudomonadaceae bacterium]
MGVKVIKVGTGSITRDKRYFNLGVMDDIAHQTAALKAEGHEVMVVTSGAMGAGRMALGLTGNGEPLAVKQALAMAGQPGLIAAWVQVFAQHGLVVGQGLLEGRHFSLDEAMTNLKNVLGVLRHEPAFRPVVPVFNENDVVATKELKFGDNDELAARLAMFLEAEELFLLTGAKGLFTNYGTADARLIGCVDVAREPVPDVGGAKSDVGSGGPASKAKWAHETALSGVRVHVIDAERRGGVLEILRGQRHGTLFAKWPQSGR